MLSIDLSSIEDFIRNQDFRSHNAIVHKKIEKNKYQTLIYVKCILGLAYC